MLQYNHIHPAVKVLIIAGAVYQVDVVITFVVVIISCVRVARDDVISLYCWLDFDNLSFTLSYPCSP